MLVKCILAGLVISDAEIGLSDELEISKIGDKVYPVVNIDGKKFVLGEQIQGARRRQLDSRGTAVHLARKIEDTS